MNRIDAFPLRFRDVMHARPLSEELGEQPEPLVIDPDRPAAAAPDPSIHQTLCEIRDAIKALPQDAPAKMWVKYYNMPAAAGEANISSPVGFRYLYIEPVARTVRVYAGLGKMLFLASLTTGHGLRAKLPIDFTDIYIDFDTAATIDQLKVIFSTSDMDITIV